MQGFSNKPHKRNEPRQSAALVNHFMEFNFSVNGKLAYKTIGPIEDHQTKKATSLKEMASYF